MLMNKWDYVCYTIQAVTDFPAAIFAGELIDAYPEAKVILTNRDVDSWYESVFRFASLPVPFLSFPPFVL